VVGTLTADWPGANKIFKDPPKPPPPPPKPPKLLLALFEVEPEFRLLKKETASNGLVVVGVVGAAFVWKPKNEEPNDN
jgi:hypothetical protein